MASLPDLSRFELQCLRSLWSLGDASIRDVHGTLERAPSYSTVKKIIERLEEKGAVERVRRDGKQYLVIASGGHGWSEPGDATIAFALP